MIKQLVFNYDKNANAFLSEDFEIEQSILVRVQLESLGPVVTQKLLSDGSYATYGQSPKESDNYSFRITVTHKTIVRLATPVAVLKGYILK